MNPSHHLIRHSVLLSVLILSACQMPTKQNRDTAEPRLPVAEIPTTQPEVAPQPIPDTPINIVEAHVIDSPAIPENPNKQTGAAVFARLNNNFSGPICNDNAAINQWKKRYAGNPKSFSNHLGEILPLLDYVSIEVERRKLPAEFALIPIIESWYQPHALGTGGPAGLWQMIGTTAKNHGVKIQAGYDGRFSVVDSTDAALSYLGTLQGMFKDWQRAVMGYNAGEFRILRAIRSSGNKSEGQDYWPHGLSPITYAYIAKLQALSCFISQPEKNNLALPNSTEFTPLAAILVEANSGSLDTIARRYQIDANKLKQNNPAYKRGEIAAHAPRRILMPAHLAGVSLANSIAETPQNPEAVSSDARTAPAVETNTGSHEIKNGDTLWSIAKRYGLSITNLRKLNRLGRNPVLRVGQRLKLAP